jgi:hypothetical protein
MSIKSSQIIYFALLKTGKKIKSLIGKTILMFFNKLSDKCLSSFVLYLQLVKSSQIIYFA